MIEPLDGNVLDAPKRRKKKRSKANGKGKSRARRTARAWKLPRPAILAVLAVVVGLGIWRAFTFRD